MFAFLPHISLLQWGMLEKYEKKRERRGRKEKTFVIANNISVVQLKCFFFAHKNIANTGL